MLYSTCENLLGWIKEGGTKSLELQMQSAVRKYCTHSVEYYIVQTKDGGIQYSSGKKKLEIHMRTCPHDHGQIITWHTVSFEHWHNMNSHPCRWLRRHSASLHSPLTETNQLRRRGNFKDIISIVLRIRHSLRNLILIMPRLLESCRYVSGLNSH